MLCVLRGWSGVAKVLGKHPVPGRPTNIGIKHCFSCINVCQVPRDLANVNVLENNV